MDPYELGAMSDEEISGEAQESILKRKIEEMIKLNEGLFAALKTYEDAIKRNAWYGMSAGPFAPIASAALGILYAAEDMSKARWDVENWHTGALKWMTDGAQAVREGKIKESDWGGWGIRLSESAKEIAAKLADTSLVKRAKEFASTMPQAFAKTVSEAGKGVAQITKPLLGQIPWWAWGIGGTVAAIYVLRAVSDTVRAIKE